MNQLEVSNVIATIKLALRAQKISYKDLAMKLNLSESGLKKSFAGHDMSLTRVLEICNVLKISLGDLISTSENAPTSQEVQFSDQIQKFFLENLDCFNVYWKLAYELMTPMELARDFSISKSQLTKYLKKLNELGLIEWQSDLNIKKIQSTRIHWVRKGEFVTWLMKHWGKQLIDYVVDEQANHHSHFSLRYYRLTLESYRDLQKSIEDLNKEFAARSLRETRIQPRENLHNAAMVAAIAKKSFVESI